jgi:Zn-dependent protease
MQIDLAGAVFVGIVVIFSAIIHEVAHGYMANWLGDPTARLAGRLTLNPLVHIDPVGSILLPVLLIFTQLNVPASQRFLIGYAKPVPYNPFNLPGLYDEALVAFAGPATNAIIAIIFGLVLRFFTPVFEPGFVNAFQTICYINMLLALFNLLPIPPLDGSKVITALLPGGAGRAYESFRFSLERLGILQGTLLILMIFYFLSPFFSFVLQALFQLLTGTSI